MDKQTPTQANRDRDRQSETCEQADRQTVQLTHIYSNISETSCELSTCLHRVHTKENLFDTLKLKMAWMCVR